MICDVFESERTGHDTISKVLTASDCIWFEISLPDDNRLSIGGNRICRTSYDESDKTFLHKTLMLSNECAGLRRSNVAWEFPGWRGFRAKFTGTSKFKGDINPSYPSVGTNREMIEAFGKWNIQKWIDIRSKSKTRLSIDGIKDFASDDLNNQNNTAYYVKPNDLAAKETSCSLIVMTTGLSHSFWMRLYIYH